MAKKFIRRLVVPKTKRIYVSELEENDVIDIYKVLETNNKEEKRFAEID